MIEIAPPEYHIICTYDESIWYCFSLNINGKTGWRLQTVEEWTNRKSAYGWYLERYEESNALNWAIPVRDILCT
jgi:hypothetical protein